MAEAEKKAEERTEKRMRSAMAEAEKKAEERTETRMRSEMARNMILKGCYTKEEIEQITQLSKSQIVKLEKEIMTEE